MGIACKSQLDVIDDLRSGRLEQLLPEFACEAAPLTMVCMHRSQVTPVVLQLRDFLRARCEQLLAG
jgi:DNA-binding transcriptional LysR family regulator